MAIGQAAGMMAVSSIEQNTPVAEIDVKDVQRRLEAAGCALFE
jgi:hypothetical protein